MVIITKNSVNELILNINNNSREVFASYTLKFTHSLSQEVKTYSIDTSDNGVYGSNTRYCEIILDLTGNKDLNYVGQYTLEIFGNGSTLVYTILCDVKESNEQDPFIQYESDNENGEKYIYVE